MRRMMQVTAALALTVALGGCAGDRSPDADNSAAQTGAVGTSGSLDGDREFVEEQLAMGTAEIELGRLAQQRGTHAEVKEYGAMMVRDHQLAADELQPIAAKVNTGRAAAVGNDDHGDHKETFEELSKLSGRDFDRKYIDEMIDDHEAGIEDVDRRAGNAAHADVKAWAVRTLPKMREHLERARAIKDTLDRAGSY